MSWPFLNPDGIFSVKSNEFEARVENRLARVMRLAIVQALASLLKLVVVMIRSCVEINKTKHLMKYCLPCTYYSPTAAVQ